jgi:phosphoribosylcarboxyaminoimidazole (NCAIR) mutase
MALGDDALAAQLEAYKEEMAAEVEHKAEKLKQYR